MTLLRIYRLALALMTVALVGVSVVLCQTWRERDQLSNEMADTLPYVTLDAWPNCFRDHTSLYLHQLSVRELATQWSRSKLLCRTLFHDRQRFERERDKWEYLARAMSAEADRRHLDKNFPRVHD
jgi:hypothetical protein